MTTQHGLGRLFAPDVRDEAYPMRAALPRRVPVVNAKTWAFRGAVLDQGSTGTCTAHAAAHFLRCAPKQHRKDIDPYALYREGVLLDSWIDNDNEAGTSDLASLTFGSDGRAMCKALQARGVVTEYRWGQTVEDITDWVTTRGPVMIGTPWTQTMFTPDAEGFIRYRVNDATAGGHETCVRGVNRKHAVALVINSWGPTWNPAAKPPKGLRCPPGHFLIAFEDLHALMRSGGDAVSPVEK